MNPQSLSNLKPNRSGSSAARLTRTNTNATDAITNANSTILGEGAPSLRTIDMVPSARPSVSYLDKLWTQIDVLDDVKSMANQVRLKGSFFNDKFNQELTKLKEQQNKLLETMSSQHFSDIGRSRLNQLVAASIKSPSLALHSTGGLKGGLLPSDKDEIVDKDKLKQEKLDEFFGDEQGTKSSRDILYRKQNFDEMNKYVDQIKDDLVNVGESMKRFDETTREIW